MSDIKLFRIQGDAVEQLQGSAVAIEASLQELIERRFEGYRRPYGGVRRLSTLCRLESMEFGDILRDVRSKTGIGIKRLAPELGVSYSYLSKLESNQVRPSEELVERVAHYFHYDRDRLLLAADRVPPEIIEILREHPEDAIGFLRERFGRRAE
jgi:transcriptional regulator with XRE-family HTH domain